MTIGINTSPVAGREGTKLTARLVKSRLDQELVGNVSLRVRPTDRPDAWEVHGRGELQLAVLIETMRREGFELTVGKPHVVAKEIDGTRNEPMERVTVDVPEAHVGTITTLLSTRKGELLGIVNHGTGWVRMDWRVPARGPRRRAHRVHDRDAGARACSTTSPTGGRRGSAQLRTRRSGVMVADRTGPTTAFALLALGERGELFVGPGVEVYEGMIVGENARQEEMDVNPTKEKKLTNMRSSTSEETERLTPPTGALLGAGARVHRRGRVRRGDARLRADAQGRARPADPRPGPLEGQASRLSSSAARRESRARRPRPTCGETPPAALAAVERHRSAEP